MKAHLNVQAPSASGRTKGSQRSAMQMIPPQTFLTKLRGIATPRVLLFLSKAVLMGFGMGTFESFLCASVLCSP